MISLYSPLLREMDFTPVVYYYYDRADMLSTTPAETTQTHSLHEIMYVVEGQVSIIADGTPFTLGPGQYIWLDAMTKHSLFMPERPPLSMLNIEYQFEPISRCCSTTRELAAVSPCFRRMLGCGKPYHLLGDGSGAVLHLLKLINQVAASGWADEEKFCSALCMQLLFLMAQNLQPPVVQTDSLLPGPVERALSLMESRYAQPLTNAMIAAEAGVSLSVLGQLFKQHTHGTVNSRLQAIRIQRARELLLGSGASVQEVAYRVGIINRQYFVQLFTQAVGVSPTEYRKQMSRESGDRA
ncbi:MAG: AraC family transcriptional regulator [Clostridiales bacterium]|nr:AraC family transcriptional regulator [Clostridiales bacterium]